MSLQSSPIDTPKIIVAMSGGVDSSVAAALLKRAGFSIGGVFLKLYDSSRFREGEKRAKKVAKILKIPIQVLDFRKEFKKNVVDYFLKEYKQGLTPNPCVVCNKEIKFGLLLKKSSFLATGHYVRFQKGRLLKGRDRNKDQSYFLWQLSRKQLDRVFFPVGNYTKDEVRKLAEKFKLPVFEAPESQEICFVPKTTEGFLKRELKPKPGPMAEQVLCGVRKIIGQHKGLPFYTIGQRKGIGLSGGPYWVLDKNIKKNLLIVTRSKKDLYKKDLVCQRVNWISGKSAKLPLKIKAKVRYRAKSASAVLYKNNRVIFDQLQRAIAPGQSVVFYKGEELLGGGIICRG